MASGGTLFLDEIGNIPLHLQTKLLTAIQTKSVTRVGSNVPVPVDIRLICATNRDISRMVADGQFREDLFFRINTIHLTLPPLRERMEDIVPLAELFMRKYAVKYGKDIRGIRDEAREELMQRPWQGNIRELQHVVEKAVILSEKGMLEVGDFFPEQQDRRGPGRRSKTAAQVLKESVRKGNVVTLDDMEKELIRVAMRQHDGNLTVVAQQLGITRQTLYNKLKKYGM